jgi:spore maturation protein SpmA
MTMTPLLIAKKTGAVDYSKAMHLLVSLCERALSDLPDDHPARAQIEQAVVAATLATAILRNNWTPLSNLAIPDLTS